MSVRSILRQFLSDDPAPPPAADDYWYESLPTRPPAGDRLTNLGAMQCSAVASCVRILAETVAALPLHVYRRDERSKTIARDHRLYRTLHDVANEDMTAFEMWEYGMASLLLWGNFYALQVLGSRNDVLQLRPLDPSRMTVLRDAVTKRRVYAYADSSGGIQVYTADDILHLAGLGFDGLTGYSPVAMHARSMGLALDAEHYAARFFANNAVPPHYVSFPTEVGPDVVERLMKWLAKNFRGVWNSHKIGVLGNGGEIKSVPINHRDIQFLELRKFQVEDIARIFRVPLHLIQSLDRATNNNIEHQGIDFATHSIRPWCTRIEKRLNMQLLGPGEDSRYLCEFNLAGLLRGDAKSRGEFYGSLRNSGVITANEIREFENLPWIEGGDELMIQGAMVPISQAGKVQKESKTA